MKILVLVFNNFVQDSRVERSIEALQQLNHEVSVIAIGNGKLPSYERKNGYDVYRIHPLRSVTEDIDLKTFNPFEPIKTENIQSSQNTQTVQDTQPTHEVPQRAEWGYVRYFIFRVKRKIRVFPGRVLKFLRKTVRFTKRILRSIKSSIKLSLRRVKLNLTRKYANDHKTLIGKFLNQTLGVYEFNKRKERYQRAAETALSYARNLKPDFLHVNDFNCLVAAELINKEMGLRFVYDTHELWPHRNRPNTFFPMKERKWEEEFEKEVMPRAEFNMTVCKSISDFLSEEYNIDKPLVIRNTPRARTDIFKGKDLKKALNLKPDDFLAVYVGKITFNRGVMDILNSIPYTNKNVHFCVLGFFDKNFERAFDARVKKLGIQDRISKYGPVPTEEVSSWITTCDLSLTTMNNVCLSYLFALPNKLFESLQAQLPILGPSSPEIQNIVDTFKCGTTYTDKDHKDLAKRINYLYEHRDELKKFKEGSIKASEQLIWENEVPKFKDAYNKIG